MREAVLRTEWFLAVICDGMPQDRGEKNNELTIVGINTVQQSITEAQVCVAFKVVEQMIVPVLLGTSFVDEL